MTVTARYDPEGDGAVVIDIDRVRTVLSLPVASALLDSLDEALDAARDHVEYGVIPVDVGDEGAYIPCLVPDSDGGARVTFRMTADEKQLMLNFMRTHGFDNVSGFVRSAIRWAVNGGMA